MPQCKHRNLDSREGVEEKNKLRAVWPGSRHPHVGLDCHSGQLRLLHAHSRTHAINTQVTGSPSTSHQSSCPESAGSPQLWAFTRAKAPQAAVLSQPPSSPRINSEATGCVNLNHQGACWRRGSDCPGSQVDYISPRGLGAAQLPSTSYCLPEVHSEWFSAPTMSQVGGPGTYCVGAWGGVEGLGGWALGGQPQAPAC